MMRSTNLGLAVASLFLLGGCAATASPQWDARFGDGPRALNAQQLIDPGAPARNAQTVAKSDGRNTRDAMDRHAETYRSPPPTNVINIGVGGGAGR
jgi:hypothetical protein